MGYFAAVICVAWYVALTVITYVTYKEMKSHRKQLEQLTASILKDKTK
jgi:hypothetical protein